MESVRVSPGVGVRGRISIGIRVEMTVVWHMASIASSSLVAQDCQPIRVRVRVRSGTRLSDELC